MGEGVFDIRNMERLGSTEVEQVNLVAQGVRQLLVAERKLQGVRPDAAEKKEENEKGEKENQDPRSNAPMGMGTVPTGMTGIADTQRPLEEEKVTIDEVVKAL